MGRVLADPGPGRSGDSATHEGLGLPNGEMFGHDPTAGGQAGLHIREAEQRGLEIADVVDAANTYAVFVWGPDGIKLEYVEHKPTFSLV